MKSMPELHLPNSDEVRVAYREGEEAVVLLFIGLIGKISGTGSTLEQGQSQQQQTADE